LSATTTPPFTLLGGPLHELGVRAGLVRHHTDTVRLGLLLGVVPWLVGVLIAVAEGRVDHLLSVEVIGAHVRLLVAVPLLFVCESVLDPQLARFARYCGGSGLLQGAALAQFETHLERTRRWSTGWVPEAACLAAAVLVAVANPEPPWGGMTSTLEGGGEPRSLAGWWYWIVGLTLFRFLVFRLLWRLALWWHLLWRLSRLDLRLMPAHADGCGGLGLLGDVQSHFLPFVTANTAVLSASFAEDIGTGRIPFETVSIAFVAMLLGGALLVLGPLLLFVPRLWACRQRGLGTYMALAARYANAFERKWFGKEKPPDEPLLGTPDIQTLADLTTAVGIVRTMRVMPIGPRTLVALAAAVLVPILPLLTLRYPLATMVDQLVHRLIGL
jgi:hypothetical protein